MARAKPSFTPDPRTWNAYQVAARLNISEGTFRTRRPELEAAGFPQYDAVIAGWDSEAIERWMDQRSGIGGDPLSQATEAALAAVRGRHAGRA